VSLFLENGGQLVFGAERKTFPNVTPGGTIDVLGATVSQDQLVLVTRPPFSWPCSATSCSAPAPAGRCAQSRSTPTRRR
jgi:hypothetical protein